MPPRLSMRSEWLWVRLTGVLGAGLVVVSQASGVPDTLRFIAGIAAIAVLSGCLVLVRRGQVRRRDAAAADAEQSG